jgi:hypothetical protein
MTYQRNPHSQRPRRYSLREDGGSILAPLLVAVALVVFIGYLLLGPAFDTSGEQPSNAPRTAAPNAAAPPVPTPAPAKPQ